MKNKKLFLAIFALVFIFGLLTADTIMAQGVGIVAATEYSDCNITFKPNISIPGTGFTKGIEVPICPDSIGQYIVALYTYGARFAGVVAMFMLVFAGWQWLMAAGRADQIAKAKETIVNVFVGLALLFGGYLLMSQISQNSVNFKDIALAPIKLKESDKMFCSTRIDMYNHPGCGDPHPTTTHASQSEIICIDTKCDKETEICVVEDNLLECPGSMSEFDEPIKCICAPNTCVTLDMNSWGSDCDRYKTRSACKNNICYRKEDKNGYVTSDVCGTDSNDDEDIQCESIEDVHCDKNKDCFVDTNGDGSSEYCCADVSGWNEYCRLIGGFDVNCIDGD